ncbi:MAG: hypothetical protein KAI61_03070, partial [Alphaproteobacteria bacterium]|nr:hypothetical protein [Alphaproteobacteria bacterium]
VALVIVIAVSVIGNPIYDGLALWGISIAAEISIMAVAALFFSMVLSSASGSALATLGVYALSRMAGTLMGIMDTTPENWIFAILGNLMKLISIMIPRLDMMGQTTWLVYGVKGAGGVKFLPDAGGTAYWMAEYLGLAGFIGVQGIVFVSLLLAASAYDFTRRQF